MNKNITASQKFQAKIPAAIAACPGLSASFKISDDSVQAEQRLAVEWHIAVKVDSIQLKKDLAKTEESCSLFSRFSRLNTQIAKAAYVAGNKQKISFKTSSITKTGPAVRAEQKADFVLENGRLFLAALKNAQGKTLQAKIAAAVAVLQEEQKQLLVELRKSNASYLASCKSAKADKREADVAALASGEFWKASTNAIKDYFNPPFDKNYLAGVSERWRAALFLECKSVSYKSSRGWGHKLEGTGRAYLCGIDDNGDEWGHTCQVQLSPDNYGNLSFDATVEEAMAELFSVNPADLEKCSRQGDLLFRPCTLLKQSKIVCENCGQPKGKHAESVFGLACYGDLTGYSGSYVEQVIDPPHLEPEEEWTVRESHVIKAASLRHNGRYFAADEEIRIEHTSHQPVIIPAGEWCLHTINIVDAD